ncbi:MAG: FkbM family methyltransferase [Burkholderiaceae bacterium]
MSLDIKGIVLNLIGRRVAYRLGRSMYLSARGDIPNDFNTNGEMLIQSGVLRAWRSGILGEGRFVVFDVGANIGEWSNALLEKLDSHEVAEGLDMYIFEPVPSTAKTLRNSLPVGKPNLHIEEMGLSSSAGAAEIYISAANAGTNSLHKERGSKCQAAVLVNLTTVRYFCESRGIRHIHLLKCDAEGHDMEVIRGALPMLRDGKVSVMQFEYNHRWVFSRNFLRDVFVAIESMPYKVAKLQADYVLVVEEWHPELDRFFEGNYALIHNDAMHWFPAKVARFDRFNSFVAT